MPLYVGTVMIELHNPLLMQVLSTFWKDFLLHLLVWISSDFEIRNDTFRMTVFHVTLNGTHTRSCATFATLDFSFSLHSVWPPSELVACKLSSLSVAPSASPFLLQYQLSIRNQNHQNGVARLPNRSPLYTHGGHIFEEWRLSSCFVIFVNRWDKT